MNRPIDKILEALDRLDLRQSRNGSGLMAQCPAHEDRTPSLSISEADDRVLLRCFAGCEFGEIMKALGLEEADAFEKQEEPRKKPRRKAEPKEKPKAKLPSEEALGRWQRLLLEDEGLLEALAAERGWLPDALEALGIGRIAGDRLTIAIPTRNAEGELTGLIKYLPIRPEGMFDDEKTRAAAGTVREYLFPNPATLKDSGPIFLVEGEPDSITAASLGLQACGIPGAHNWRPKFAAELAGREIVLIPDLDEAGRKLAERAKADLLENGCSVRILDLGQEENLPTGGDLTDYTRMMLAEAELSGELIDVHRELELLGKSLLGWADTLKPEMTKARPASGKLRPAGELLDEIEAVLRRFVILPSDAAYATLALWVCHTHAFEGSTATPYLLITSAERRCGKSRVLEVLEPMVREAWMTAEVSAPVLFRRIERDRPTLLLDELDAVLGGSPEKLDAWRGVINAGNRASGKASRVVGNDHELRDFSVFCPKAFAGIETVRIPDTVRDRSITISIKRRTASERVEKLFLDEIAEELAPLRADLEAWAEGAIPSISKARPEAPQELHDRAEEGWRPLLAIADLAGGDWPIRARAAARALSGQEQDDHETHAARILGEIRILLGDDLAISTAEILEHLNGSDELPFGGWRDGRGLDPRGLSRILKPYGVRPKKVRAKGQVAQGFHIDQLADAFERWLPPKIPRGGEHDEHPEHRSPDQERHVPDVGLVGGPPAPSGSTPEQPTLSLEGGAS